MSRIKVTGYIEESLAEELGIDDSDRSGLSASGYEAAMDLSLNDLMDVKMEAEL